MKENSIKNERSSIEEDMKILEEFKTHGYAMLLIKYEDRNKTNLKIEQAIEHILSDYKRTLKENEILKKEKEQAWEEWNNLEQGSYETEQKLKQQIKELQRENEELKERIREHTLLISPYYVKENYIPIQKVKDKIEELNKEIKSCAEIDAIFKIKQQQILQELLGSEK